MWYQEAIYSVVATVCDVHVRTHACMHARTHTHKLSVDHQLHNGYFTTVCMVSGVAFHIYLLPHLINIHIAYYVRKYNYLFVLVCSCMYICVSVFKFVRMHSQYPQFAH